MELQAIEFVDYFGNEKIQFLSLAKTPILFLPLALRLAGWKGGSEGSEQFRGDSPRRSVRYGREAARSTQNFGHARAHAQRVHLISERTSKNPQRWATRPH